MAMSPRLLRPRASGAFDPAAQVYFNAVAAADGQQLEPAVKKAINDFVLGCKADGIWSAVKASCILMGARTLAGALTPLVGTAPTNNNFVSGDYNRKTGLVGNASTKFLNSNRSANADPLNNCHAAAYASTAASGFQMYFGGETANAYDAFRNGANAIGRSRGGTSGTVGTGATAGLIGHSRAAAGTFVFRAGGSQTTVTSTSGTADNANIYVFARNVSGSLNLPTDARIAFYSIGESLTLSLLDSRVSSLYAAIAAAIP
jgi:hypothetical protein